MPTRFDSEAHRQTQYRDSVVMSDIRDDLKRLCKSRLLMLKIHFQQKKQKDKEKLIDDELKRREELGKEITNGG